MKKGITNKKDQLFEEYLARARECEVRKDLSMALELYEKCAEMKPGDPEIKDKIQSLRGLTSSSPAQTMDLSDDDVDINVDSNDDDDDDNSDDKVDDDDDDDKDRDPSIPKFSDIFKMTNLYASLESFSVTDVKKGSFSIPSEKYEKLHKYQKEGVQWLWSVHNLCPSGGILCDDMGLGKTVQVSTFLLGLFEGNLISKALIVVPATILNQWKSELSIWAPGVHVDLFYRKHLEKIPDSFAGICLTTYGMVQKRVDELSKLSFSWDYVILDEGHTIKNSRTKTTKAVHCLKSERRLILTGTPVTNSLQEFRILINWACNTKLLGSKGVFHSEIEDKIIRGTDKKAENYQKVLGDKIAESLRNLIAPHILRRNKSDVFKELSSSIPVRKNDIVVWIKPTDVQKQLYKQFLKSNEVDKLIEEHACSLGAISVLRKICNHPFLLGKKTTKTAENLDLSILNGEDPIETSAKNSVLLSLLEMFGPDHKTLIFSHYTEVFEYIKKSLESHSIKFSYICGSCGIESRKAIIADFTKDKSIRCLLLTTDVGAVGLNLVAADRVIIYDQAVDRAYRIGQKRDVIVYRLFTCGTVEENIYKRQVLKKSLMHTTMTDKPIYRYFSNEEIEKLFEFESSDYSETQKLLSELHKGQRKSYPTLDEELKTIKSHESVFGFSDHDLLFTNKSEAIDIENSDEIKKRVDQATDAVMNSIDIEDDDDLNVYPKKENENSKPLDVDIDAFLSSCNNFDDKPLEMVEENNDDEKELKRDCEDCNCSGPGNESCGFTSAGGNDCKQRPFVPLHESNGVVQAPFVLKRGLESVYGIDRSSALDADEPEKKVPKKESGGDNSAVRQQSVASLPIVESRDESRAPPSLGTDTKITTASSDMQNPPQGVQKEGIDPSSQITPDNNGILKPIPRSSFVLPSLPEKSGQSSSYQTGFGEAPVGSTTQSPFFPPLPPSSRIVCPESTSPYHRDGLTPQPSFVPSAPPHEIPGKVANTPLQQSGSGTPLVSSSSSGAVFTEPKSPSHQNPFSFSTTPQSSSVPLAPQFESVGSRASPPFQPNGDGTQVRSSSNSSLASSTSPCLSAGTGSNSSAQPSLMPTPLNSSSPHKANWSETVPRTTVQPSFTPSNFSFQTSNNGNRFSAQPPQYFFPPPPPGLPSGTTGTSSNSYPQQSGGGASNPISSNNWNEIQNQPPQFPPLPPSGFSFGAPGLGPSFYSQQSWGGTSNPSPINSWNRTQNQPPQFPPPPPSSAEASSALTFRSSGNNGPSATVNRFTLAPGANSLHQTGESGANKSGLSPSNSLFGSKIPPNQNSFHRQDNALDSPSKLFIALSNPSTGTNSPHQGSVNAPPALTSSTLGSVSMSSAPQQNCSSIPMASSRFTPSSSISSRRSVVSESSSTPRVVRYTNPESEYRNFAYSHPREVQVNVVEPSGCSCCKVFMIVLLVLNVLLFNDTLIWVVILIILVSLCTGVC